ncbi:hypothetical protein M9H77_16858 [Catharanthus roseus]|uniref:Uncharacterized protein n=1 Tax=Catharanthus roseus TaxID=4058 RepID=A0ACC0B2Y7_CATRO|nr:hypothetical protein M9H77_16858 [Catharanthus roseus]
MGYLLKEALKTLCGVNQWAYAVFWKIGCQNPKLLIWEECYYEPVPYPTLPGISGPENPDWSSAEANNSQIGVQAGNRVHFLVTKMMMDNQVNVLGEGLIGRAAFTGNHQWILSENYKREAYPPEVLKEVFQQFSAGMQTIAVIPVLPHGVVQLGSYMAMVENIAFVNDVKTLIHQLGCVPGVLLSENYATKEPDSKFGGPVCPGNSSGRSSTVNSSFIADSYNNKSNLTPSTTYIGQTSSIGQGPVIGHSILQASNNSLSLRAPDADQYQAKVGHSANNYLSSTGPLNNALVKAEVIPSNPEVWLNQQTSSYSMRACFDRQPSVCSSAVNVGSLTHMETADVGVQNHMGNGVLSDRMIMSILRSNAGVSSSSQDFVPSQPNMCHLNSFSKSNLEPFSNLGSLSDANLHSGRTKPDMHHVGSEFQGANSSKSVVSLSSVVDNSVSHKLLTGSSINGYHSADDISQIDWADMSGRLENDLYQTLSVPVSVSNENKSFNESISHLIHKDGKHEYELQSTLDAMYGAACVQPHSGDDLFDILGIDFKNKLLSCCWDNSQNSGSESNITSLDKNISALIKRSDGAADSYPVNQKHSESSLFSEMGTGTDHLLDAVISSIQPSAKKSVLQNLDDNISCRTTLTNMSSSSVPNASQSSCEVGMTGKMQGEFLGTKSLGKPGSLGSSFRSGPCKDDAGSYSQSSSIYGSQISSWIDQGHDVKPTTSVSTAYSKKPDETSKTNRKRLKPGENPRPRPKDRQMIQDRVKELREIVPNGGKCSIDALLERTIKHMLFLQSVTKHADKLKQSGESKIISKEGGLLMKDNYEGGATWAYEVGSQSMVCPIIVEDLNQPRQMLVEMLCEERGLFLEIADIIRGLGLTILKGVMETRTDKIWARFAVEANRDVTRMEIFMSLVRLLEQTVKNGVAPMNSTDNENMIAHQFPKAASIPASGRTCSLE